MSTSRTPGNASASVASQELPSGMPTMGMPPQDGRSPPSGQAPHPYHPQAPPGPYGGGQPPYQAAQGQPYPPQGNFAPQNFPPYGYPAPPMYGGGGPPPFGGPQAPPTPQYYGGYSPGFPSQHQQQPLHKSEKSSPSSRRKTSPRRSTGSNNSSTSKSPRGRPMSTGSSLLVKSRNSALERQGMEAGSDLSNAVDPMRTAFHFFVNDMQEKLRQVAKEEVMKSTKASNEDEVDVYLVNTNLNSRLMKEWEDAAESVRDVYMEKEEDDRKRFMADDEIASRHCATLTARARSPKFGSMGRKVHTPKNEGDDEEQSLESGLSFKEEDEKKRDSPTENGESPTKKSRTDDSASDE